MTKIPAAVLLLILFVPVAYAIDPFTVSGSIVRVDAPTHKLVIKPSGTYWAPVPDKNFAVQNSKDVPFILSVKASSLVTLNGKPAAFGQLAAGQTITAKYNWPSKARAGLERNTGESVAVRIDARR